MLKKPFSFFGLQMGHGTFKEAIKSAVYDQSENFQHSQYIIIQQWKTTYLGVILGITSLFFGGGGGS